MNSQIRIEPAKLEDAAVLLEIHAAAVHQTAASYYSEDIIESWARLPITPERIARIRQGWIENPNNRVVVARKDNQTVGFGFISQDCEVQGMYVHPDFGRCGVGTKIFAALEQEAISLGLTYLKVNAAINAEAFYRKQGFEVVEYGSHRLASGVEMACVKMQKRFGISDERKT